MYTSKMMNKNFKVKYGRLLVGFSGLVARIGFERVQLLLGKALRSRSQVKRFMVKGVVVSFYAY